MLKVATSGDQITMEMFRNNMARHITAKAPLTIDDETGDDPITAQALRIFYSQLMSPTLDLSSIDINSLDGSMTAVRMRDEIDMILGPSPRPAKK